MHASFSCADTATGSVADEKQRTPLASRELGKCYEIILWFLLEASRFGPAVLSGAILSSPVHTTVVPSLYGKASGTVSTMCVFGGGGAGNASNVVS